MKRTEMAIIFRGVLLQKDGVTLKQIFSEIEKKLNIKIEERKEKMKWYNAWTYLRDKNIAKKVYCYDTFQDLIFLVKKDEKTIDN